MKIVTIKHPKGLWLPVTLRKEAGVAGFYQGALFTNDWFKADFSGQMGEPFDLSVQIKECPAKPEVVGLWVNIRWNGKEFAAWREEEARQPVDMPIIARVKNNWERKRFPDQKRIPDVDYYNPAYSKNNGRVIYTSRVQHFMYDNIKRINPQFFTEAANAPTAKFQKGGQGIAKFNADFDYFLDDMLFLTNFQGSRGGWVCPTGKNKGKRQIITGLQIVMGGALVELWTKDKYLYQKKEWRFAMKVINAQHKNLEDFNYQNFPLRYQRPAITAGPTLHFSEPFSIFHPAGAILPLLSNNTEEVFIPTSCVEIVDMTQPIEPQFTNDWSTYPWYVPSMVTA